MKKQISFKNYKRFSFLILLFFTVCVHPVFAILMLGFPIYSTGVKWQGKSNEALYITGRILTFVGAIMFSLPLIVAMLFLIGFALAVFLKIMSTPFQYVTELVKSAFSLIIGSFMFVIVSKAFLDIFEGLADCKHCGMRFPHPKRSDGGLSMAFPFTCPSCKSKGKI